MNGITRKSIWRDIKYWTFSFIILALLFEMAASIFFYRKYISGNLATFDVIGKFFGKKTDLSLYHRVHELVRPDSSKLVSRKIADQIWDANVYSYEPWLQFKVADRKSEYVNISGFERKCVPQEHIVPGNRDTFEIFFIGGSTMYGYNVADAETIPSQFLRIYKQKYPRGKSVKIHNYGIPYYYSKQELILLSKFIFEGRRPDLVIFLDGLNDFYPSRMLYYDRPHFSYAMQQAFDDKMFEKSNRTIMDTSDQFYIDPPGIAPKEYYHQLLTKYLNNIAQAHRLSEKAGISSFFFCQPVPFYNYPNRDNDPISYKVSYDRYDYIYPLLKKEADSSSYLGFLGDMLISERGLPFVDQVHYSPEFSRKIANRIFEKTEEVITR